MHVTGVSLLPSRMHPRKGQIIEVTAYVKGTKMANKEILNEQKANEQTAEQANAQATEQTAAKAEVLLDLIREPFKAKDGRQMFSYCVKGKVRGRDVKVDFNAKDQGGYEVLDILFGDKDKLPLAMFEDEMTDDKGNTTRYTVYEVRDVDEETGEIFSYKVKPARESDKSILRMILAGLPKAAA